MMTIDVLIYKLKQFDKDHTVEMEIDTECNCLKVGSSIQDVQWKDGKCVLYGCDYP